MGDFVVLMEDFCEDFVGVKVCNMKVLCDVLKNGGIFDWINFSVFVAISFGTFEYVFARLENEK